MNIKRQNGTLTIDNLKEMSAVNARSLRDQLRSAYSPGLSHVEIDLSEISIIDGYGLGALASFYAIINSQNSGEIPVFRLLHPQPPVQQLLELTRLNDIFEIVLETDGMAGGHALAPQPELSAAPV